MHTISSESVGHTNESENRQEAMSREHVEALKYGLSRGSGINGLGGHR